MTRLRKIALGLVALLALLAAAGWAALGIAESRSREAIRLAAERAAGTGASVGPVEIDVFSGTFAFSDLAIDNPEGFSSAPFLELDRCEADIGTAGLAADLVDLAALEVQGVHLAAEFAGGSLNLETIKENVERARAERDPKDVRRFSVKEVRVSGTRVTGTLALRPGAQGISIDRELDEVALHDLGTDGEGVPLSEITREIVRAILRSAIAHVADRVPGLEDRTPLEGRRPGPRERLHSPGGEGK